MGEEKPKGIKSRKAGRRIIRAKKERWKLRITQTNSMCVKDRKRRKEDYKSSQRTLRQQTDPLPFTILLYVTVYYFLSGCCNI